MATIIALTNQKGGVGKTTTSCALAAGLSTFYHKKVLTIDLDPQGNLGFSLGLDIENCNTIYDVLTGKAMISEAIQHTDYCDIVTSNILLSSAALELASVDRELLLKKTLSPILPDYDYIIIDTPPALNVLTVNAYVVADYLIIPMAPEILSLLGVSQIRETIGSVRQNLNPDLEVLGILLTKFDKRTLLGREVQEMAENITKQMGSRVFKTHIRPNISAAEAPAHGLSVYDHAPNCNAAKDYREFIREILEIITQKQLRHMQEVR